MPVLRTLFVQLADPGRLQPLGLDRLLDWTAAALRRVDRKAFFTAFDVAGAVQYFYEPFLAAFDPELRRDLGVWYTPREIVRYQVARVDRILKDDLDLPDGLADPRVVVLDPCCGTGAYLVEVLARVEVDLRARGDADALLASDLKTAATTRLFGFELLPAPFVIAHLQMGLLLDAAGAPLGADERAAVFLTNALTGWEPPDPARAPLLFPELAAERAAAEAVKQEAAILVILGNPPYNGFAGLAVDEERDLSDAYRGPVPAGGSFPGLPAPQGQGLNDLYVRFFRMAERRIVNGPPGGGVVSFISNYSWLDGLSHPLMRARFTGAFDAVWVDCLNGDKYKTGKVTPEGKPDPSVFSTESNREGIQVGTAVTTLVLGSARSQPPRAGSGAPARVTSCAEDGRPAGAPARARGARALPGAIRFRHWWGKDKRAELLASAEPFNPAAYQTLAPPVALGLPFVPVSVGDAYLMWPLLPDLLPISFPGIQPSRDLFVVSVDRDILATRMHEYFNPAKSNEDIATRLPEAMTKTAGFNPQETRNYLVRRGFLPQHIVRFLYRPFDLRWLYWEPETSLLDRKREDYVAQIQPGNIWLGIAQVNRKAFDPPSVTSRPSSRHVVERGANFFPLLIRDAAILGGEPGEPRPNLSPAALAYLARFNGTGTDDKAAVPPDSLFFHAVATLHAPAYRTENAGALRQDWPRIPLPADRDALLASAALGRRVAALLDPETPVPGVTTGTLPPMLRRVGALCRVGEFPGDPSATPLDPATDLAVTAGWGHHGQGGAVMPGRGRLSEWNDLDAGGLEDDLDGTPLRTGPDYLRVHLNERAAWDCVPPRVWDYTLGGYPVLKKWLSYREASVLGRPLRPEEAREFTTIARRIATLLALGPDLDAAYRNAASV